MKNNRLIKRQDLIHIAILVSIALGIGVYLIATIVLIAKDGTLYIECARQIADNPIEAVRNMSPCPGYPFLIYLMHKVVELFYGATSLQGWIISAQTVSLLSKIIASAALYLVGSYFVGPRLSFYGVLILSILPDSAEYGSDVLTEWSFLMFLTTGFLLLLLGVQYHKNWIFGLAGIAAGLGYLTRSECCQLVIYGSGWLLFNLIRPQGKMKRIKATGALILLLAGFAVIAIPYMRLKGYVFPDQSIWKLPAFLSISNDNINSVFNMNMCLAGLSTNKTMGNKTLIINICETLMYYFIPGLLIGCYYYFRKQSKTSEQTFFSAAFIVLNIVMLLWQLYCRLALSRRYSLALVAFTIFYIPVGLYIIAGWLSRRTLKSDSAIEENIRRWFFILLIVGMAICLPKLFKIIGTQRYDYREAAMWLNKNTASTDIIAVPDVRITFYAERKGLECMENSEQIPGQANYIVRIVKSEDEKMIFDKETKEEYSTRTNNKKGGKLVIYRVTR
jgi:uncharacterized membrane protein YqaE (UPF0057 family)